MAASRPTRRRACRAAPAARPRPLPPQATQLPARQVSCRARQRPTPQPCYSAERLRAAATRLPVVKAARGGAGLGGARRAARQSSYPQHVVGGRSGGAAGWHAGCLLDCATGKQTTITINIRAPGRRPKRAEASRVTDAACAEKAEFTKRVHERSSRQIKQEERAVAAGLRMGQRLILVSPRPRWRITQSWPRLSLVEPELLPETLSLLQWLCREFRRA
jgi:hypothetical protein